MSVTAAKGFVAAGVVAGIKDSGSPDLALVVNQGPLAHAAAVFTGNRFKAAPVQWSRQALATPRLAAVVLNSGGANACTGDAGFADAAQTAAWVAAEVGCEVEDVAVCSTGLIGVRLPMEAVLGGIQLAAQDLSQAGGPSAAEAIMTTDTVAKQAEHGSPSGWTIGGMAKGAGMLAPA
ncbi:MAG: bifunctional ornithine acetyltransferase/N-acetylglutamate synthase, partial [Propionicimonas sp.]|nr:bifunctional ornithine acetyltransferase/N-acetylglutamate synthase [Propionicimonas sp.]